MNFNWANMNLEQKFLQFFFENLRRNKPDNMHFAKFPYVSFCGREQNYLRCDDLPFVLTKLDENSDTVQVNQISSARWAFYFDPNNLYHNLSNGRLYYNLESKEVIMNHTDGQNGIPSNLKKMTHLNKMPCRLALVKSGISIELMKHVREETGDQEEKKFKFEYKSKVYYLNTDKNSSVHQMLTKNSQYISENDEITT
jgi:hypothetical protein